MRAKGAYRERGDEGVAGELRVGQAASRFVADGLDGFKDRIHHFGLLDLFLGYASYEPLRVARDLGVRQEEAQRSEPALRKQVDKKSVHCHDSTPNESYP